MDIIKHHFYECGELMLIFSILLAENKPTLNQLLQIELQQEGYEVTLATDGKQALTLFSQHNWDLLLLDWVLPQLSGLEISRRIRKISDVPIILLSPRNDVAAIIAGLDAGADDYITIPFEISELLARIRTALRRPHYGERTNTVIIYQLADLILDIKRRIVTRAGIPIELTRREFDLLQYLMEHQDQVINRNQLLISVWGYQYVGETNVVDVYIRYLRNKLDRGHKIKLIHTIRGVGYVLRKP